MGNQFKSIAFIFCTKATLLLFNIILWFQGLITLVLGLYIEIELYSDEQYKVQDFPDTFFYSIIGIGTLVVIVCSLGCSCIVKGESILLYLYGGLLAVILVVSVGLQTSILTYRHKLLDMMNNALNQSFTQVYSGNNEKAIDFNLMQSSLHCCGINNYSDWLQLVPARKVPTSCCIKKYDCVTGDLSEIYKEGCRTSILSFLQTSPKFIIGALTITSLLPLSAMTLSCCLANQIKKEKYDIIA